MRDKDDWGESMDDMDASDWESNFDGPTDRQLEKMYEQEEYEKEKYDELIKWADQADQEICYRQIVNEDFEGKIRQMKIVEWLAGSKFAIRFKKGSGFFIPKGVYISFENGTSTDLFDWLKENDIWGGKIIENYSIAYTPPESIYGEKLSFFKRVIEFPFTPKPESEEEPPLF
jgi:hypothetical protein